MPTATALLLAESEPGRRATLERHLRSDGFDVLGADYSADVLELARHARPDLVLLAAGLADDGGLDLCERLRADREVPVILLGRTESDTVDRVSAFRHGADDFLSQPIAYDELVERIRAVLRRTEARSAAPGPFLQAGEIVIDDRTRRVTLGCTRVPLAAKEYDLLLRLAREPDRVFTKAELLRDVWGFRSHGRNRTLDSHASRLRCKLAKLSDRAYVVNEWGVGYRLLE